MNNELLPASVDCIIKFSIFYFVSSVVDVFECIECALRVFCMLMNHLLRPHISSRWLMVCLFTYFKIESKNLIFVSWYLFLLIKGFSPKPECYNFLVRIWNVMLLVAKVQVIFEGHRLAVPFKRKIKQTKQQKFIAHKVM